MFRLGYIATIMWLLSSQIESHGSVQASPETDVKSQQQII
jgi:hypothetical protein